MLKLKTLKFKNIGRFTEEQVIQFDKLGNLVQVDAKNNNTGGSSGSGKSTVFNSLDWLLGLSDTPVSILQSRLTKEGISVSANFDWDGMDIWIGRSKSRGLVIELLGDTTISGSSKLSEEKLDEILGIPRNLFRPILHKRQGETGFFLQMTPAKMNEFLTDCLGLGSIRSKIDLIGSKIKDLSVAKEMAQNDLQAIQAALEATKSAIVSIGEEPKTDVTEDYIELLKNNLSLSQNSREVLKEQYRLEKEELDNKKPKLTSVACDRSHLVNLEAEIKTIESQINRALNTEKERQNKVKKEISDLKLDIYSKTSNLKLQQSKIENEINIQLERWKLTVQVGKTSKEQALKLVSQIKTLRSGICQTCEQSWITEKAKLEEDRLLKEVRQHKINIEAAENAENEINTLKSTISSTTNLYDAQITALIEKGTIRINSLNERAQPKDIYMELQPLNEKIRDLTILKLKEKEKESVLNEENNKLNNQRMDNFFIEQKALANKHREILEIVTKDLEEKRNQYDKHSSEFKAYKEALERYKRIKESIKLKELDTTLKIDHMTQKVGTLKEDLEIAKEVERCLKSYLSCLFDDSLDYISDTATRILRAVPTMANATIRLEGTKETKAGAVKEQVTAYLDNDGEIEIPIKSLSGGERSAIDLAVDLAVGTLIQEKANKGIDIMILDEPFNGFDSIGIENTLEMLKNFATDKRILIVEHDSVAKEFIGDKITVIREGENSYINSA